MTVRDFQVRHTALIFLASFGPEAKEAVPALIEAFKDKTNYNRGTVVRVLRSIGPAAKQAVPVLTDFILQPDLQPDEDATLLRDVQDALKKINK